MTEIRSNYDLEKRTTKFGENIIKFAKTLPKNIITVSIIIQLVKSGINIVANYCEAIGVSSKKKILKTKYLFVKKNLKKLSIG